MPQQVWHNVCMVSATLSVEALPSDILVLDLRAVEEGSPLDTLIQFSADTGIELRVLHDIVIPARTLKHRRSRHETLSRDESDKLARVARVFRFAVRVFGHREKALRWMSKSKAKFEGRSPLELLQTEVGGRLVEELLGQIDHGMFA